jgi:hypothetical protein
MARARSAPAPQRGAPAAASATQPKRYSGRCINNSIYPQVVGAYFGDLVRVSSGAAVVGVSGHIFARRAHDATVGDDWR